MPKRKTKFRYKFKPIHLLVFAVFLFIVSLIVSAKGGLSEVSKITLPQKIQNNKQGIEKIEISGVEVNNFMTQPTAAEKDPSYYAVAKTADYNIFFIKDQNLFYISITSYPFEDNLHKAEDAFLTTLGIGKEDACKLNVDVTSPSFVNPDKAGEVYHLSFCSNNN